eukprot:3802987-Amphidinium_carterae.1
MVGACALRSCAGFASTQPFWLRKGQALQHRNQFARAPDQCHHDSTLAPKCLRCRVAPHRCLALVHIEHATQDAQLYRRAQSYNEPWQLVKFGVSKGLTLRSTTFWWTPRRCSQNQSCCGKTASAPSAPQLRLPAMAADLDQKVQPHRA